MIDDPAGWVGASAAVVAAGLVAWQSWETRRAADASADALTTANAALGVAREQAAEAVRARIDASTPQISVHQDGDEWPPLEPSDFGSPNPIPPGNPPAPMFVPQDARRSIMVRANVKVTNESLRMVRLEVRGLIHKADERTLVTSPVRLGPGDTLEAWCVMTHNLAEWIEVYEARTRGEDPDEPVASVRYVDPADTGADDLWNLSITTVPITPMADKNGAWQIIYNPKSAFVTVAAIDTAPLVVRHRRYYLSRSRNLEIPA